MTMTLDEAIKHTEEVATDKINLANTLWDSKEAARCNECAEEHRQLAEWLKDYKRLKEQENCDDEYIRVPKKALKYRTAGMVAYNAEWLKNHFDIERIVICGVQEPNIGHWIRVDKDKLRCSKCDVIHLIAQYPHGKIDWCPNCGANMIEGDCRYCEEYKDCPCGKDGHENGTSQGYSKGECKNFKLKEREE